MKSFSTLHFIFLIVSFVFILVSMLVVSKLKRKDQNIMFLIGALVCSLGIFYRYAMGLSLEGQINIITLCRELLQVCSFNFVLLPLMLIPKFEIARQYAFFFSMFAAATTLFSISKVYSNMNWYDISFLNSFLSIP